MFTTSAPRVRDQQARYGPHEVDRDPFPAARVLADLPGVPAPDVAVILARYAALRSWLLRDSAPASPVAEHAARAARAYLASLAGHRDAEPLARIADGASDLDAVWEAAIGAETAGHVEGAYALLRAGYLAARRRRQIGWARRSALRIARLLDRAGLDGAELWARRARQLTRLENG